jgi:hypothetical protein
MRIDQRAGSSPARPPLDCWSVQWIGAKISPLRWPALICARNTLSPCGVATRTRSRSPIPCASASSGWISTIGSRRCCDSFGERPVRVIVCHWSR